MTRPGIEPRSPGRLANTLTAGPMSGYKIKLTRFQLASSSANTSSDVAGWLASALFLTIKLWIYAKLNCLK